MLSLGFLCLRFVFWQWLAFRPGRTDVSASECTQGIDVDPGDTHSAWLGHPLFFNLLVLGKPRLREVDHLAFTHETFLLLLMCIPLFFSPELSLVKPGPRVSPPFPGLTGLISGKGITV